MAGARNSSSGSSIPEGAAGTMRVSQSHRPGSFSSRSAQARKRLAELTDRRPAIIEVTGEITEALALRAVAAISRAKRRGVDGLIIRINSEGGRVKAARQIVAAAERAALPVLTHVTGICLSAAMEILLAGHARTAAPSARLMIHRATVGVTLATATALGASGLRRLAENLDHSDDRVLREMALRGINLPQQAIADYRAARDVWFTAHQAARHGLINSVEVLS